MKKIVLLCIFVWANIQINAADEPNNLGKINMKYYAMLHSKLPPAFAFDFKKNVGLIGGCLIIDALGGYAIYDAFNTGETGGGIIISLMVISANYCTVRYILKDK